MIVVQYANGERKLFKKKFFSTLTLNKKTDTKKRKRCALFLLLCIFQSKNYTTFLVTYYLSCQFFFFFLNLFIFLHISQSTYLYLSNYQSVHFMLICLSIAVSVRSVCLYLSIYISISPPI